MERNFVIWAIGDTCPLIICGGETSKTFDDNQEFECAPDVPSGDDILVQLEGMVFGDESAGKELKPIEKPKTENNKKQKKRKKTPMKKKKKEQVTDAPPKEAPNTSYVNPPPDNQKCWPATQYPAPPQSEQFQTSINLSLTQR
jgi:hypothetical protein